MAPWARLLANVLVTGGSVFVRSFIRAYEQVVAQGGVNTTAIKKARDRAAGRMSIAEARQILNVTGPLTADEVTERHLAVFTGNAVEQGGSYFLQCKAEHAKDTLEKTISGEFDEATDNIEDSGENMEGQNKS